MLDISKEYQELKRSARNSVYSYIKGNGYRFQPETFEDVFHDVLTGLIENPQEQEKAQNWAESKNVPIKAYIAGKCRYRYIDVIRKQSRQDTLSDWQPKIAMTTAASKQPSTVLKISLKQTLTKQQYYIVMQSLHGYTKKDIAKQLKISRQALHKQIQSIRSDLEGLI